MKVNKVGKFNSQYYVSDVSPFFVPKLNLCDEDGRAIQVAAVRKANLGRAFSDTHKRKISNSRLNGNRRTSSIILAYEIATGNVKVFGDQATAAKELGCTKQLISQVLNPNTHYYSAKGWTLQWLKVKYSYYRGKITVYPDPEQDA